MKFFFLLFFYCICGEITFAQQSEPASSAPIYTQYPLPQFSILLTDSTTWYTKKDLPKKKKTMIMLFSPDCEHCKHETELIKKNIHSFKGTQIIMVTPLPFQKMKEFYDHYELGKYKNIIVGRDPKFFFSNYFKVHYLPFLAIYDKDYKLLKTFEGSTKWEDLLKYL